MDIKQAIEIITNATGRLQATRDEHQLIVQAIQTIQKALEQQNKEEIAK